MIAGLIKLMRPKQWVKNSFVLAPLVFAGVYASSEHVMNALLAMFLFCIASSATYVLNDITDIEKDKKHPTKRFKRPLASGEVTKPQALVLLAVLYGVLIAGYFVQPAVIKVIIAYLVLQYAYTFFLKHQPVIDIVCIATGFVLRVLAGAVALGVPLSGWMFITTFCLALYLGAIKRRQELLSVGDGAGTRDVLKRYSVQLIDRYAQITSTGSLMFYSMFVMSARPEMIMTIPFVIIGLFRYWYVVEMHEGGESPTDVLVKDWPMIVIILGWIAACVYPLDVTAFITN